MGCGAVFLLLLGEKEYTVGSKWYVMINISLQKDSVYVKNTIYLQMLYHLKTVT